MITKEQFINKAREFLGVTEGTYKHKTIVKAYNSITPLPRGYRLTMYDAWCAGFVSAVANLSGFGKNFPYECGAQKMVEKAQSMKMWATVKTPRVGWLCVYDWQKDGHADHVGIVCEVTTKQIKVIEGNYNDRVGIRTIKKDNPNIKGYVALKFKESGLKPDNEIAKEVIKGLWGNGEERKKKLKTAGYDPDKIQKLVNKMI